MKTQTNTKAVDIDRNKGDFHYKVDYAKDAGYGLSDKTIHFISEVKEDPDWVREFRLRGLKTFLEKPLPTHWASKDLEAIDFTDEEGTLLGELGSSALAGSLSAEALQKPRGGRPQSRGSSDPGR